MADGTSGSGSGGGGYSASNKGSAEFNTTVGGNTGPVINYGTAADTAALGTAIAKVPWYAWAGLGVAAIAVLLIFRRR